MSDKKNEKLLREAQPVVVPMQYVVFAPPGLVLSPSSPGCLLSFALVMYLLYLKLFNEPGVVLKNVPKLQEVNDLIRGLLLVNRVADDDIS